VSNKYAEEDFADAIAARAIPHLIANGVRADNVGCLLLEKNQKRWGVSNGLAMSLPKAETDGHSANLFRTIQIQLNSGQALPATCQSIIATYQPQAALSCF
jgi:hypothetical protein